MAQASDFLLLDASCLLNLYATGRLRDIASAQPYRLGVAQYVLEREALYVWRSSPGEEHREQVREGLTPLVEEGIIRVLRLEHRDEEATFVNLASMVDDGEAITAALAVHRGCAVATDDRKARRVLAEHTPIVPLVSTLELLRQWAEESSVAQSDLHAAMAAMRSGASYVPGERDPLYEWWQSITGGEAN
jgi:predicted nucleic acid-binding protein